MGRNINRFAVAAAAAFVSAGAVQAQDWTGAYAGIEAGSAATDLDFCLSCVLDGGEGWADPSPRDLSFDGFGLNIYAGYNIAQVNNIVYGIEVAYGGGGIADGIELGGGLGATNVGYEVSVDYLASARARVGYSTGNMLLYATGGVAMAGVTLDNPECPTCSNTGTTTFVDSNHIGSVIGVGVDYMINQSWILRGQYLAYSFGSETTAAPGSDVIGDYDDNSASLSTSVISVGIAYKF